jgi:uncharacterized protein
VFKTPTFDYLLLKLASRCNLNCTYCYWFRDKSVYERSKLLTPEAEAMLLEKLALHIKDHGLEKFSILFHGGEPLLIGKPRFLRLAESLRELERTSGCRISLAITTNGVLVDEEWATLLRHFRVSPTISIDGPAAVHDAARIDLRGRGSHERVIRGLEQLRKQGIEPGVLAVADPSTSPDQICSYFVDDLGLSHFDILVPDATHDDDPPSIAKYYTRLFDLWYDDLSKRGVTVRYVRAILTNILGGNAHIESIGYGPIQTCAMMTDGDLEPLDVLRIAGYKTTSTTRNITTHTFQDVADDPVWRSAFDSAQNLCSTCKACAFQESCGGGFLPHRYSSKNGGGYNNPSVYCGDLQTIFDHVGVRIAQDLRVAGTNTPETLLQQALAELSAR